MFGNRKRKLQDEEESLVPHGLIWHATAEPTPEEIAKSEETLGYTVNYAQEIERTRREQAAQPMEQSPVVSDSVNKTPQVIPWWRVEQPQPEVERPISRLAPMPLSAFGPSPTAEPSRPPAIQPLQVQATPIQPAGIHSIAAPPVVVQPIPAVTPSTPIEATSPILQTSTSQVAGSMAIAPKVEAVTTPETASYLTSSARVTVEDRLVPKSSEITEALALVFSRLRSSGRNAWQAVALAGAKAFEGGRRRVQALELGDGWTRASQRGKDILQGSVAKSGQYARTTGNALGGFSRAGMARVQQLSARVRQTSTASTGNVAQPAVAPPSTPSPVRVALAASAVRARIIAAQQLSAWRLRRERVAIDSRFWASMTMSAIAAVIALIIISIVPHYAARSLPSRILTNSSVNASVAAPASPAAAATPATPAHQATAPSAKTNTSTPRTTTAKAATVTSNTSTKPAAKPKAKHVAYDDYVAPNTYKYYGNGSKASR